MLKNKSDKNRNLQISSQMILYYINIHFDVDQILKSFNHKVSYNCSIITLYLLIKNCLKLIEVQVRIP